MILETSLLAGQNIFSGKCNVSFEEYDGPLELLLFLVEREELDIFSVPVLKIIDQYLEFIRYGESLDLNIAGEYLVIASSLIEFKGKMLLPSFYYDEDEQEEIEEMEDNFRALLIKYREYKEELERRAYLESKFYPKGDYPELKTLDRDKGVCSSVDLMSLIKVAQQLFVASVSNMDNDTLAVRETFDIDERIDFILSSLEDREKIAFVELFWEQTSPFLFIATFIALLELVKRQRVRIFQVKMFDNIWLSLS